MRKADAPNLWRRRLLQWGVLALFLFGQFALTQPKGGMGNGELGQISDEARYALDHFVR